MLNEEQANKLIYKYRLVNEYNYFKNPIKVGELLDKDFIDKKLIFCSNSEHTLEVIHNCNCKNIVGILKLEENNIDFDNHRLISGNELDTYEYDFIVFIGYWNKENKENLLIKYKIPEVKTFEPYKDSFLQTNKDRIYNEINKLNFVKKKPTLVLIVMHDARDFFTKAISEISTYFNTVKIYIDDFFKHELNEGFDFVLSLNGSINLLEYFFKKHTFDMCVIFKHGCDGWKYPYIKSLICPSTKLIVGSCDWIYNFYHDIEDAKKAMNFDNDRAILEQYSEDLIIKDSDGFISNFKPIFFDNYKEYLDKYLFSYYLIEEKYFVFNEKLIDIDDIRVCYTGSVCYDYYNTLTRMCTIDRKFEEILNEKLTIDAYSFYSFDDNKLVDYINLAKKYSNFNLKKFLPHKELLTSISVYDFGLLIYEIDNISEKNYELHLNAIIQGKLISYLAAGLPVIVSEEYKSMSDFVKEYGVGISIKTDEIHMLNDKIKETSYNDLKVNVRQFQRDYCSKNYAKEMAKFLYNRL